MSSGPFLENRVLDTEMYRKAQGAYERYCEWLGIRPLVFDTLGASTIRDYYDIVTKTTPNPLPFPID